VTHTATLDVERIRAELPATGRSAYLNTGTAGPLPATAIAAAVRLGGEELATGRATMDYILWYRAQLARLREQLAAFVGADADEIALTHNTTEGMNIAVWGLEWEPDDEIVTTTLEHEGGLLPLYQLHRRRGVRITFADIGNGEPDRTLEALDRALDSGVKLLALSHVTWSTGAVLPLEEIVALAHERGVLVLVDGAQSIGAIPVDVHPVAADIYAFTGQKWLCGPHGTGGMFVRRDRFEVLQPTFTGYVGIDFPQYRANDVAGYAPAHGAQRFEVAASYIPSMGALEASVAWLSAQGPIFERIAALGERCLAAVSELPSVELLTPANHAGLVAFRIPGVDSDACVDALRAQGVEIRSIPDNGAMRIACGFFNTEAEIDRAVALIHDHARSAA
jgi:L-cysteine/cystine lyase